MLKPEGDYNRQRKSTPTLPLVLYREKLTTIVTQLQKYFPTLTAEEASQYRIAIEDATILFDTFIADAIIQKAYIVNALGHDSARHIKNCRALVTVFT